MIKSNVKLYGPSLDKGIDAMDELLSNFKKWFRNGKMVSTIVSVVDPSIDYGTGKIIRDGKETPCEDTTTSSSGSTHPASSKSGI
jgi:hypothetical protein